MSYFCYPTSLTESKYLRPIAGLIDEENIELFHLEGIGRPDRKQMNGCFTVKATLNGTRVGVIYNDFRVYGGSFGRENSQRICAFLKELQQEGLPAVFMISSIGVRIMEGRGVFPYAFKIVPALRNFARKNLLITAATGRCLGLGALLFACGDYRLSLKEETSLNLTGPEVFRMFFGEAANFEEISSSKRQFEETSLINEVCENKDKLNQKIKNIISRNAYNSELVLSEKEEELLERVADGLVEVFPQHNQAIRTFIATKNDRRFAIFMNPPGKANLLNVGCIDRFNMALALFDKLQLPVVSLVDTPGADPRIEQNDKNIIAKLTTMSINIVDYPHAKVGIVYGRCYGGASVFSFPEVFGGEPSIALEEANLGIMSNQIIDQLLCGSPRFHTEWKENSAKETADLQDLIDAGVIGKRIKKSEMSNEVELFLQTNAFLKDYSRGVSLISSKKEVLEQKENRQKPTA